MKWDSVYHNQLEILREALSKLHRPHVTALIDKILSTQGSLFFVGVGKNGHVAAKAASTFSSLNIKSFYLDPVEALHGALSVVTDDDLVIGVSKSGNTPELYAVLSALCEKSTNIPIVLVHGNDTISNRCKEISSISLFIKISHECDMFNIVPIASVSAFTMLLQSVAIHIAHLRGLNLDTFLGNHPGGHIGTLRKQ